MNTDVINAIATGDELIAAGQAQYSFLVGLDPNASDPYHLYPLQASYGAPVFEITADGTYDAISQKYFGADVSK